jgi:TonB family protein
VSEKPSAGINIAASDVVVRASGTAPLHRDVPLQVVTPGKATPAEEVVPPANSQLLNDPESSLAQLPPGIVISSVRLPPAPPEVSLGVTGGTLVHRVPPAYPKLARDKKLEGEVVLAAIVGEDGRLHDMSVVSGDPILAQAARQAVAQWRYSPYQLNGKPVSMRTNITVQFKFQP